MSRIPNTSLKIAIATGTLTFQLANALARQRQEEPETHLSIFETTLDEQQKGLNDGRYCAGLSLAPGLSGIQTIPLWRDELFIILPPQSPLLAFDEVPLRKALQYPLILCHGKNNEILNQEISWRFQVITAI